MRANSTNIFCCGCGIEVRAVLIDGATAYPHRKDLAALPFWRCPMCLNFVGCHHKIADRTRPLGVIPTEALKKARMRIHALVDPLWKSGVVPRGKLYAHISGAIGYQYHTAEIRSMEEAETVYKIAQAVISNIIGTVGFPGSEK